jgi:hypothetical protein
VKALAMETTARRMSERMESISRRPLSTREVLFVKGGGRGERLSIEPASARRTCQKWSTQVHKVLFRSSSLRVSQRKRLLCPLWGLGQRWHR